MPKKFEYFYGFDWNMNDSNPATCISYPEDVDNHLFAPAKMAFGGSFNYGGWAMKPGEKFMPKPCLLNYDGHVEYYLNPNDYTQKEDGQPSQNTSQNVPGNFMMEWGKIFVKRWQTGNVYHFRCSDMAFDSDYKCWSNYDKANNEIPHFYTPIYNGSDVSGKMRSLGGKAPYNSQAANIEIAASGKNGADWYIEVFADRKLLEDLCILISKSTDSQTAFGTGRCSASNAINTGTMDKKGLCWGSNNQTDGVKVFGMENPWGNLWRRTAGWIVVNGQQKIKMTRGTKDGSAVNDYNLTGEGYISIPGVTPKGTNGGFISKCKVTEYGLIPYDASGSSSTYLCDGLWYNNSGTTFAIVGGCWSDGSLVGVSSSVLRDAPSNAGSHIGASLSCKPLAK